MPGRDGTGPLGLGPMSGRGFGAFYGCGRGFGRSFLGKYVAAKDKDILKEEKELLQKRLDEINNK